jgi:hypothetical protein
MFGCIRLAPSPGGRGRSTVVDTEPRFARKLKAIPACFCEIFHDGKRGELRSTRALGKAEQAGGENGGYGLAAISGGKGIAVGSPGSSGCTGLPTATFAWRRDGWRQARDGRDASTCLIPGCTVK